MAVNRNIGRQPEAPSPLISGMGPVGMQRTALLLTAVAALWAAPAHAQTDFLTLQETRHSCVRREPTITSTAPTPAHYRSRACAEGRRRSGSRGWPRLIMGTTGAVAARLAGADGKTIYICGRTASGGIVAAKAISRSRALATASFIRILTHPSPRTGLIGIRPAASHLLRKLVRQPSAFVAGIVLSTRMLQQ
jgi:hypothetical protein